MQLTSLHAVVVTTARSRSRLRVLTTVMQSVLMVLTYQKKIVIEYPQDNDITIFTICLYILKFDYMETEDQGFRYRGIIVLSPVFLNNI